MIGGVAVAGIVVFGEHRNQFRRARGINIVGPTQLFVGDSIMLIADAVDGRCAVLPIVTVAWQSNNLAVAPERLGDRCGQSRGDR